MRGAIALAFSLLVLGACDFPYDAEGTLDQVHDSGVLRVGVSERAPWTLLSDGEATGIEPDLVTGWAKRLGAGIEWTPGPETELVAALREQRIDVLIGGFTSDSLWISEVAPTQPFSGNQVMFVAPGENAFLLSLDRFLSAAGRDDAAARAGGA